jgi:hypothetical protein
VVLNRFIRIEKEIKNMKRKLCETDSSDDLGVTGLNPSKRGRKTLLGEKLDSKVQFFIKSVRDSGGVKNVKEIFWDMKFLSEVTGCQKTQVSDHTGSTVLVFFLRKIFDIECLLRRGAFTLYHIHSFLQ